VHGAGWPYDGSRVQNMQTASTRPCDSENRTDRSPIEDPSTGGLKSPRKLRAINYVPTDQPDPRPRPPTRTVIIEASPSIAASCAGKWTPAFAFP
jgi:hypothetical protein